MDFDWDEANTEHIARHGIEPEEAEEALGDPHVVKGQAHRRDSQEPRAAVLGQTEFGRLLFVVFTVRAGRLRVVTARDATVNEKRRYR
ncbi:BrnT family toxin [Deinococcus sp. MIMF12]|uniref:BrnT family toxin n=1 Tax=Deinococcus rhizophilus TaxID=3049544 RepID=A0ABT7JC99_9DEIO|nr:BrnT family toxin [Deinococcus rhizophilus]MDL2342660.1 BrnT family toxin [Deinococcus rhizophilus]